MSQFSLHHDHFLCSNKSKIYAAFEHGGSIFSYIFQVIATARIYKSTP